MNTKDQQTLAKSSPLQCRLVSIKKTPKGRKDLNKKGKTVRGSKSRAHAKSQREPWLLATSLTDETVLQLINIYKQRMQIEEGFRDLKSPRLGLGMDYSGSRSLHRLSNLLLVASLALFALLLVGLTAEKRQLHHQFQANTIRDRRVLSFVSLALRVIKRITDFSLSKDDLNEIQNEVGNYQMAITS